MNVKIYTIYYNAVLQHNRTTKTSTVDGTKFYRHYILYMIARTAAKHNTIDVFH